MKRTAFLWMAMVIIGGTLAVNAPAATHSAPGSLTAQAPRLERNVIKVGIVDTYSGPPAVFGNDALNGFKLALTEINRDGVLGARIEFVTRDERLLARDRLEHGARAGVARAR